MTKFLKIVGLILLGYLIIFSALLLTFSVITKDAYLDRSKLIGSHQNVIICDENGNEITSASLEGKNKSVSIEDLQPHIINAFIASEDRNFYKHNGLNYKRMIKAFYKNIVSRSFKEGASTISQQLIKNTHLSNDKTIKRKLNEIKLTRQLEKKYSKNDILEMYLNTIYFGHSCYGLQSAAQFYFDKKAENLNLTESATIVGLLASPNNFSPFKNPEKSLKRRNMVLKAMAECKYIDETAYKSNAEKPLDPLAKAKQSKYGDYINALFDELEEIDFDFYTLSDGCTIKTYLNTELQQFIENTQYPCDNSVIVTDNATGGVNAYKSTVNGAKRQPGSTVKPLFVYAPAIEEKQLHTFTKITDEKTNFNGYEPENYDKRYHGTVTITQSLAQSLNIPAVKTLNALTVKKAEKYIAKMNVKLEDEEKNLSLALGGMKYGMSLKNIADCYSVFPNKGFYCPSRFIKQIIAKDGKTIYSHERFANNVYSEGTCSLINEMLIETAQNGTAKKLKKNYDVAAKTGTCGNENGNTDAYAMAYTSEKCFGVWLGDRDNKRLNVTGGNQCCSVLSEVLDRVYTDHNPPAPDTESGTTTLEIDGEEYYQDDKITIADPLCPKLNRLKVKVLNSNIPTMQSDRFNNPVIPDPLISVTKGTVNIRLCQTKYYLYRINRIENDTKRCIYDGKWIDTVIDKPQEGTYTYTVIPYYDDGTTKHYGKEILLPSVNLQNATQSPQVKIPDIADKDWYNQ